MSTPADGSSTLPPMTTRSGKQLQEFKAQPRRHPSPAKRRSGPLRAESTQVETTTSETGHGTHTRWLHAEPGVEATPTQRTTFLDSAFITPSPWIPTEPPQATPVNRRIPFNVRQNSEALDAVALAMRPENLYGLQADFNKPRGRQQGRPLVRVGETGTIIFVPDDNNNSENTHSGFPAMRSHPPPLGSPFHSPENSPKRSFRAVVNNST
ncbi:hypothetical protein D9611_006567 [Ephemerocybe angulata]|uniref:Uncharacterized protein n=1 Tax=Ephemerocybe angulata TaxID=980116 RepID=A0A8H5C744_9AGAR|nr:hypothetical protein D9611_006567 [Tulosesus angulatus]